MSEFSRRLALFAAALAAATALGCASLQNADLENILGAKESTTLDEATVLAGLKEALRVGSGNAVSITTSVDGFLGNALIRIALPEQLDRPASALRNLGMGAQVDELEVAMNRAAEQAAGEARGIFWDAITSMTIADGFAILNGHDTAATDYFRGRTESRLRGRFEPIVREKTSDVGLGRLYGQVADAYAALPLTSKPDLVDLDSYVTDEALAGLFTVLAQEEQAIRRNPGARTTDLLRRVFGD